MREDVTVEELAREPTSDPGRFGMAMGEDLAAGRVGAEPVCSMLTGDGFAYTIDVVPHVLQYVLELLRGLDLPLTQSGDLL